MQYTVYIYSAYLFTLACCPFVQVASGSLWGGVLRPIGSESHISDRLFLGGPTTLRGFGMWGLGPREKGISSHQILIIGCSPLVGLLIFHVHPFTVHDE